MNEPDVSDLISVARAIAIIDAQPVRPRIERVALRNALGMRLARPLSVDRDFPPFDKSLMDGYALRAADAAKAPVDLIIAGEVAAGAAAPQPGVQTGCAIAIMTGAPAPQGADCVIPVEDTQRIDERTVRLMKSPAPGAHISRRGGEAVAGQIALPVGARLEAGRIAVAAAIGAAQVEVFARPRVAILSTGDELLEIDQLPGEAQIRNSNSPMLAALLRRLECDVTQLPLVRDEPDALREAIKRGMEFDALFISGGMSMGKYDYVPRVLLEMGVQLKVTKLRIKPGKPFVFGVLPRGKVQGDQDPEAENRGGDDSGAEGRGAEGRGAENRGAENRGDTAFIFGLPGNPISGYVCALRLASRLLARLGGGAVEERWRTGRLDSGLSANGPRELYQPAIIQTPPTTTSAQSGFAPITPLNLKGSSDLFTFARANALLVRAENEPPIPQGSIVRVLELM
jgi:molybdopterin molybdotransferase